METVENTLDVPLGEFLQRPLFCFFAQESADGPRLSPLWFLWEDETVWLIAQLPGRSYPDRVERYPRSTIAIVDFEPARGRVEHVGMRGNATLVSYDEGRADRLRRKYLGEPKRRWPARFTDLDAENYRLIRFDPETVVARDQSYPAPSTKRD